MLELFASIALTLVSSGTPADLASGEAGTPALSQEPLQAPENQSEVATPADQAPEVQTPGDTKRKQAIEAIESGDYALARALLAELLVDDRASSAARALESGQPFEAMSALDEALAMDGTDQQRRGSLLMMRGKAAFAAAASDPQRHSGLFGEAQENFAEAASLGTGVAAAFRASRAARMFGAGDQALALARAGVQFIDGGQDRASGLDVGQHYARTWAEASFDSYVNSVRVGDSSDEALAERAALFDETQTAFERFIGDEPTNPWGYTEMAKLAQWGGKSDRALVALEAGIGAAPSDFGLHTAYIQLAGDLARADAKAKGFDEEGELDARFRDIMGRYGKLQVAYPENGLMLWFPGYETYNMALRKLGQGQDERETFRDAEDQFAGCRQRTPAFQNACVDMEIQCRVGRATSMQIAAEIDGAVDMLFSIDAMRPAGSPGVIESGLTPAMETSKDGSLPTPMTALSAVIFGLIRDASNRTSMDKAAEVSARIAELRPGDANHQNNAGFLHRDAAMLWEADAVRNLGRAKTDEEKASALASRTKAQQLMQSSYDHYVRAAALAPDDVRIVNDAGLVMVYYLRSDPKTAEAYFLDSIADGKVQLENTGDMAPSEVDTLTEAWGDAHENMGLLEWTVRRDPAKARVWFEKALEIGPKTRKPLMDAILPLLEEWSETGARPEALDRLEARRVWTHNPLPG